LTQQLPGGANRGFKPGDYNLPALNTMLDQVVTWSTALAA